MPKHTLSSDAPLPKAKRPATSFKAFVTRETFLSKKRIYADKIGNSVQMEQWQSVYEQASDVNNAAKAIPAPMDGPIMKHECSAECFGEMLLPEPSQILQHECTEAYTTAGCPKTTSSSGSKLTSRKNQSAKIRRDALSKVAQFLGTRGASGPCKSMEKVDALANSVQLKVDWSLAKRLAAETNVLIRLACSNSSP
ncbi:unnamed protein product [Zymoseptoria tritici ST99CH_3D7]|uniref:Uncharacterized protein n=1 Tax=Zymoseptoria tritici (strain ST99CH_3D7) TaxID=1276538 RepID=A0A1X7S9Z8_ZYMT9|nr:unnamed protein product [Zymoseptoria tritici ST99CH_3D7]